MILISTSLLLKCKKGFSFLNMDKVIDIILQFFVVSSIVRNINIFKMDTVFLFIKKIIFVNTNHSSLIPVFYETMGWATNNFYPLKLRSPPM